MPLIIQDRLILSSFEKGMCPTGEVSGGAEPVVMTVAERADMLSRLETCILSEVMEEAGTAHEENPLKKAGSPAPDYITRVITNEFFFYTREPLTLKEFESLQNKIAEKAKTLPEGVQFILGSFAVRTMDNKIMNVTPVITCGASPSTHLLVKNFTSSIDVRYKVSDGAGGSNLLAPLDLVNKGVFPKIVVNGAEIEFRFDSIIPCKTPGGTSYLTAVEVCLDHAYEVAKNDYEDLLKANPALSDQIVTHVVVSNTIPINPDNTLSHYVAHADPFYYRPIAGDKESPLRKLAFGSTHSRLFEVMPVVIYGGRAAPVPPSSPAIAAMAGAGAAPRDEDRESFKDKYKGLIRDTDVVADAEAPKNLHKA